MLWGLRGARLRWRGAAGGRPRTCAWSLVAGGQRRPGGVRSDGLALRLVSGVALGLGRAAPEASRWRGVWGGFCGWGSNGDRRRVFAGGVGRVRCACTPSWRAARSASRVKKRVLPPSGPRLGLCRRRPVAAQLSSTHRPRCPLRDGLEERLCASPRRPRSRRAQKHLFRADGHFARGEAPRAQATPARRLDHAAASPAARRTTTTPPSPRSAPKEGDGGRLCRTSPRSSEQWTRSRP